MNASEIGLLIKTHRKKAGLTQIQLGNLAGIGKTSVFDMEKGKPTTKLATLLKVLTALNIEVKLVSPLEKM